MAAADGENEGTSSTDPLRALEQRLERASAAAERLLGEVAWSAAERLATGSGAAHDQPDGGDATTSERHRGVGTAGVPKPPPSGWEIPAPEGGLGRASAAELLLQTIHRLEDLVPSDLRSRLAEALRELLLALRALIDWWVERLEHRRATMTDLGDIPIL